MNDHTIGFHPQTQNIEPPLMSPRLTLGVKGLIYEGSRMKVHEGQYGVHNTMLRIKLKTLKTKKKTENKKNGHVLSVFSFIMDTLGVLGNLTEYKFQTITYCSDFIL